MERFLVETVTDIENLEVGDVILYTSGTELRTGKLLKKPSKDSRGYYKSFKIGIKSKVVPYQDRRWDSTTRSYVPIIRDYTEQIFSVDPEELTTTKWKSIYSPESRILKVII